MTGKGTAGAKSSGSVNKNLLASPPRPAPSRGIKERRDPSVTPRKFRKFFAPRQRVSTKPSEARKALRDLAAPGVNQCHTPALSSPLLPVSEDHNEDENEPTRSPKRQKTSSLQGMQLMSPLPSSPLHALTPGLSSPIRALRATPSPTVDSDDEVEDGPSRAQDPVPLATRVTLDRRGFAAQLVQRATGAMPRPGRQFMSYPVNDWKVETADFYSGPEDAHVCDSHEVDARCIPFSSAACNTNSLVAVGDDEGFVRLLDSEGDFAREHLAFQIHGNAIIDLAFSSDDGLLATASGDQTGRVYDVMAQKTTAILSNHTASLKQIRFQPGSGADSVLATSSRDGTVQIWDLRCRGGPVQQVPVDEASTPFSEPPRNSACVVNGFAHAQHRPSRRGRHVVENRESPPKEVRWTDVSVTALQFLPAGREHFLLTACDSDASIKLWDIRSVRPAKAKNAGVGASPLARTAVPHAHASWRPFGMSSLCLGSDGARLYACCKDNTVYAYSTDHLVLGRAAGDLAAAGWRARFADDSGVLGPGPLYGFRHALFHASTFFVKGAVRPARDGHSELLAVGSSDRCAVLFPTDERYLRAAWANQKPQAPTPSSLLAPTSVPISTLGTPLVRGHHLEVGSVAWTRAGKLITMGDECVVRCWNESRVDASDMRTGGETGGRRWGRGWADVDDARLDEDDW